MSLPTLRVRKPMVASQKAAIAIGVLLFLAGSWFLYDAWERRGQRTPGFARPFAWW